MLIKQIPIRNDLKNYMYLLACESTSEAIAIDPLDHALCLETANAMGWKIKIVANTHHHHDHIGGNDKLLKVYKSLSYHKIDLLNEQVLKLLVIFL